MATISDGTTTNSIICKNCGTRNKRRARFCGKCGKPFPEFADMQQIVLKSAEGEVDPTATTQSFLDPSASASSLAEEESVEDASPAFTPDLPPSLPPTPPASAKPGPVHTQSSSITLTRETMKETLEKLSKLSANIEHYFPADLPARKEKLETWKQQIARAQACLALLDNPLLQELALKQTLDRSSALAEAIHALDFTRQYTVKLIGPAGKGKSTLLTAILGQDILPTGFGSAVTGIRTYIRLCTQDEKEELRIRFLSRETFDQLLAETEAKKDAEQTQRQAEQQQARASGLTQQQEQEKEGPYTQEWHRLTYLRDTIDSNSGKTYVDMYLQDDKPLIIPRDQWKTRGREFITEPEEKSRPYLARLVDSAEFTLRADEHSLLPEGSVWVDLPGGSAGQVSHDAILQDELQQLNAVILVAGGPRYDEEAAQKIFQKVYQIVWKKHANSPAVAAGKIFIVATHWDLIARDEDMKRAIAGMQNLVSTFPRSYRLYHHHGPVMVDKKQEQVPFYPLSAFDARMATLGLKKVHLDEKQQQEVSTYKGHISAAYDQLKPLDDTLPKDFTAQDFADFPHKAMLKHSGVLTLTRDLQTFLTEQRYTMQLQHAIEQLNRAFQQVEDACWGYVRQHNFVGRDLQKLRNEMQNRKNRQKQERIARIQQLISEMYSAWQKAMTDYDRARKRRPQQNKLYQALQEAHKQALVHMYNRIDNRDFDECVDAANYVDAEELHFSWTISPLEEFTEVYGKKLRTALRANLGSILEQMVQETPATVLADMFLTTVEQQGRGTGGALDIERISFGEDSTDLENIQQSYDDLLEFLRMTAREVCRYVTMSEYIDEKRILKKDHQLMMDLFKIEEYIALDAADQASNNAQAKTPESILEIAREIMKKMVVELSKNLVENTYQRMAFIYRYELEKLEEITVYDTTRPDASITMQDGRFKEIAARLFSTLVTLLDDSPTLGAKFDGLMVQSTIDFNSWADFIEQIRKQRRIA